MIVTFCDLCGKEVSDGPPLCVSIRQANHRKTVQMCKLCCKALGVPGFNVHQPYSQQTDALPALVAALSALAKKPKEGT